MESTNLTPLLKKVFLFNIYIYLDLRIFDAWEKVPNSYSPKLRGEYNGDLPWLHSVKNHQHAVQPLIQGAARLAVERMQEFSVESSVQV